MANALDNVLYLVSPNGSLDNPVELVNSAEFISGDLQKASAYLEDNKLGETHKVFHLATTSNLLSIWTGDE